MLGNIVTSQYENTIQTGILNSDGSLYGWDIKPIDGYVLHDNLLDMPWLDPDTEEETINKGYTAGSIGVHRTYNFTENPRELYVVLRESVDENYIFGGGDNHEKA
jgi:hypothetical protein